MGLKFLGSAFSSWVLLEQVAGLSLRAAGTKAASQSEACHLEEGVFLKHPSASESVLQAHRAKKAPGAQCGSLWQKPSRAGHTGAPVTQVANALCPYVFL